MFVFCEKLGLKFSKIGVSLNFWLITYGYNGFNIFDINSNVVK